jgi:hypothetical protein
VFRKDSISRVWLCLIDLGTKWLPKLKPSFGLCFLVRFNNETWRFCQNHQVKVSWIEIEEEKDLAEKFSDDLEVVELQLD